MNIQTNNLNKTLKYLQMFASVFIISIGFGLLVNLFFIDEILEMLKPNPSLEKSGARLTLVFLGSIMLRQKRTSFY